MLSLGSIFLQYVFIGTIFRPRSSFHPHQQQLFRPVVWAGLHTSKAYYPGFLLALELFNCYTMMKNIHHSLPLCGCQYNAHPCIHLVDHRQQDFLSMCQSHGEMPARWGRWRNLNSKFSNWNSNFGFKCLSGGSVWICHWNANHFACSAVY